MSNIPDKETRDKLVRLFTFLREFSELRMKTIRNLEQYDKVLWFHEIPRESGCYCIAWDNTEAQEESDVWLEIKKPRLKPPPQLPEKLKPWLDPNEVRDSSKEFPQLRKRISVTQPAAGGVEPTGRLAFRELVDFPEITEIWENYVEKEWRMWAQKDRRLQKIQAVYTKLFSIYQKQQRLGETYEVILGFGCLSWKTSNDLEIKRLSIVYRSCGPLRAPGATSSPSTARRERSRPTGSTIRGNGGNPPSSSPARPGASPPRRHTRGFLPTSGTTRAPCTWPNRE